MRWKSWRARSCASSIPRPLRAPGRAPLPGGGHDARRLAAARPGAKLVVVEGANHVLKSAPLDRAANLATYRDVGLPLAPGVLDPIVAFVKAEAKPAA